MENIGGEDIGRTASIRKVTLASTIGTIIEWYDYFIYGTAAALAFGQLFFPEFDPVVGTLAAFASFAVGFFARPVGALVFGHFGDRIGRKSMLVVSLGVMGLATFLIGVLPTYTSIGLLAPVLLVVLRLLQGFAVGGEWGGATVLTVEHSPPERRGFYGSLVQLGSPGGLVLATGIFALVSSLPEDQFLAWGWRIPFLLSIILLGVGLYIRLAILESPTFRQAQESRTMARIPVVELLRSYPKQVLVAIGARFAPDIGFYVCGTFIVSYATAQLGVPSNLILGGVALAAAIELLTVPLFGALSDRVGRRLVYMGGAIFWVLLAFPFFWLVDTGVTPLIWLAIILAFAIGHSSMWSVAAALYSELFGTRVRYSGASLGYQLSITVGGGPAPFIATALVAWSGGSPWPVSMYLVVAALISLLSLYLAAETFQIDLSEEPAAEEGG